MPTSLMICANFDESDTMSERNASGVPGDGMPPCSTSFCCSSALDSAFTAAACTTLMCAASTPPGANRPNQLLSS